MKMYIFNLSHTTPFWNNLYQVCSTSRYWKNKKFKTIWRGRKT